MYCFDETHLGQSGDGVDFHLICQDTVCDVSNGQTHRPRTLASILHDVKRSATTEKCTIYQ